MMEEALCQADMTFLDVARTWLYLDRILEWYDELNAVRSAFFKERGVFDNLVPASTGVGSPNPNGTAIVADVFAVKPKGPEATVFAVPSPLQCPAPEYGSSFSRAVEIDTPDCRRLLVSGTASIEPGGATVHVGDVEKQIDLTMRVVEAILESRNMGWDDVTRAIAYFKNCEDMPAFNDWTSSGGPFPMPVVVAQSDICRDDLLFEVEVDAATGPGGL
jgi:enamine deaminase RidA (YjgF/YER057c/UK114 family)